MIFTVSEALLKQGENVDQYLGEQGAGALEKGLDAAFIGNASHPAPVGILGTNGINTQSGSSLNLSGLLAAQRLVVAAGANDSAVRILTTASVRESLSQRETISTSGRMVWERGAAAGIPGVVSINCPASTAIVGDFGQIVICTFGPIEIAIDKSAGFATGQISFRLMQLVDVAVLTAGAFCKVSSNS